jgi:hypothetical protein
MMMKINWTQPSTLRGIAMFAASILATILQVKGFGDHTAEINTATESVITAGMAISGLIGIFTDDGK